MTNEQLKKYRELKKNKDFILYTILIDGKEDHWFYNPLEDLIVMICVKENGYGRRGDVRYDKIFPSEDDMATLNCDEPMYFIEYKNENFSFCDAVEINEHRLLLALFERFKATGLGETIIFPRTKRFPFRFKFKNKEDYAFFKLQYSKYILE